MTIAHKQNIGASILKLIFWGTVTLFCLGISVVCVMALFDSGTKSSNSALATSNTSSNRIDDLKNIAESKIRDEWRFSEYAQVRMPVEMAGGEWSSGQNIWDCNFKEFDCVEVDFKL